MENCIKMIKNHMKELNDSILQLHNNINKKEEWLSSANLDPIDYKMTVAKRIINELKELKDDLEKQYIGYFEILHPYITDFDSIKQLSYEKESLCECNGGIIRVSNIDIKFFVYKVIHEKHIRRNEENIDAIINFIISGNYLKQDTSYSDRISIIQNLPQKIIDEEIDEKHLSRFLKRKDLKNILNVLCSDTLMSSYNIFESLEYNSFESINFTDFDVAVMEEALLELPEETPFKDDYGSRSILLRLKDKKYLEKNCDDIYVLNTLKFIYPLLKSKIENEQDNQQIKKEYIKALIMSSK